MNLYRSLVPIVSSPKTHLQHKHPHKLLDRLFLNSHRAARTPLNLDRVPPSGKAHYTDRSRSHKMRLKTAVGSFPPHEAWLSP